MKQPSLHQMKRTVLQDGTLCFTPVHPADCPRAERRQFWLCLLTCIVVSLIHVSAWGV